MGLTRLAIRLAAPTPKPERFRRCLFIAPHPDDAEVGAGATIARFCAEGKEVSLLVCLDGRFGLEHAPAGTTPEALAAQRKEESLAAARALGVTDLHFLDLSDGGLYEQDELMRGVARVIGETQPEIVFAPDPCVTSECHADHLNVGEAARRLAFFAPFPEIMAAYGAQSAPVRALACYMTARPNRFVGVKRDQRARQREALRCHASQFPAGSEALRSLELYLKLRAVDFGLRSFKGGAEGFRVLGTTQMHCLPEAGL